MRKNILHWGEITAVFGGTFDPPHLGHRIAVEGLFNNPGVKKVLVIPTAISPLKSCQTPSEHRLEMTKLNFKNLPHPIQIETLEFNRAKKNPNRPSYTHETLLELKKEIPHLAYVIGIDQVLNFDQWHRFPEILKLCHWIVLVRKPMTLDDAHLIFKNWINQNLIQPSFDQNYLLKLVGGQTYLLLTTTDAPDLSSTQIRESIQRTGKSPLDSLLPSVETYLKLHGIYGTAQNKNE